MAQDDWIWCECQFCGGMHGDLYLDEVGEQILACRDRAPAHRRGDLAAWADRETLPIPPECEAAAGGAFAT